MTTQLTETRIKPDERQAILTALSGGAVPTKGLHHLQVGREREVKTMLEDTGSLAVGAAFVRFVIGALGAGKTFLLNLLLAIAREQNCVAAYAAMDPTKKLFGSNGEALGLYKSIVASLTIKSRPGGGALRAVVERLLTTCADLAARESIDIEHAVRRHTAPLRDLASGGDLAEVLITYARAHERGDGETKDKVISWLSGDYTSRAAAFREVGARNVIRDADLIEQLKLLAALVRLAGYAGLVIAIDEVMTIHNLPNPQSRTKNYEKLLALVNELLQGTSNHLGVVFGCTPETLTDRRRGIYSYAPLQSRVKMSSFSSTTHSGPVIELQPLTQNELVVLLQKVRRIVLEQNEDLVTDQNIKDFVNRAYAQIGARAYQTPRDTLRAWVDMLKALTTEKDASFASLLAQVDVRGKEVGDFDEIL